MSTATFIIGPEHDGHKMSLDEFENAEVREGSLYELGRGVVAVIDVPNRPHQRQLKVIKQQLHTYDNSHPGTIDSIATGSECKLLLREENSERHPDLAIYKTVPPEIATGELWAVWIPELVIEVVSPGSAQRDYNEKPVEYLQVGIQEYWIVDAGQQLMTVLQRSRGAWTEKKLKPPAKHTTHLLPGLEFDVGAVLAAKGT